MNSLPEVVEAYRTAGPYPGFSTFAFDLNKILREQGIIGLDTQEKKTALEKLDAAFKSCASLTGDFTLYRGACGFTVSPFLKSGNFKSPAFSSTSLDILTAVRLAHSCDEISEGAPYLLKFLYPKRLPHIDLSLKDEKEIILPRNCSFAVSSWIPSDSERDQLGLSLYDIPEKLLLLTNQ